MSYYDPRNTFRNRRPLELEDLRRIVPSAFAEEAHESRSSRYIYIPTHHVLEALYKDGWRAYSAAQARTRDPERGAYTKHTVVLRHPDLLPFNVGDTFVEMGLTNAHDGRSAYKLDKRMLRAACLNGMCYAVRGMEDSISVKHSGVLERIAREVVDGSHRIIDGGTLVAETVTKMLEAPLTDDQARHFAEAAADLVWPEGAPVEERQLLQERRYEDRGNDVWRTFNRIQENIVKGGLRGRTADNRRTTTREIRSLDRDLKVNRGLFALANDVRILTNGTPIERVDLQRQLIAEQERRAREVATAAPAVEEAEFETV